MTSDPTSNSQGWPTAAITIAFAVLSVLGLWSFVDPRLNVPVVSPVVCSLKGATWYGGDAWGNPPGCYPRGVWEDR